MVGLNLDKYIVNVEVWALYTHCTYGDLIETSIYLGLRWWTRKVNIVFEEKITCIYETWMFLKVVDK